MGTLKGSLVMFGKRTKVLQWREGPSTVDAQHLDTHSVSHVRSNNIQVWSQLFRG